MRAVEPLLFKADDTLRMLYEGEVTEVSIAIEARKFAELHSSYLLRTGEDAEVMLQKEFWEVVKKYNLEMTVEDYNVGQGVKITFKRNES